MAKKATTGDAERACARVELASGGTGTAYLVSESWAVTCAHVADAVVIGGEVQLYFPNAPGEATPWIARRATVVERDAESDCATLRLTEPLPSVTPLNLGQGCSVDDAWWSFGYPTERGEYGVPCDGRVLLPEGRSRRGKPVIHLYSDNAAAGQGAVIAGASGSPVLVAGRVVGHISRVSLGRQEEDADLDHLAKVIGERIDDAKVKKKALARLNKVRRSRHPDRAEGGYVFAVPVRLVRRMLPAEVLDRLPADLRRELLGYLDALTAQAGRVPRYYPPGTRMEGVRVRVRVSADRQKFDQTLAEERERLRRQGYADPEEGFRVYSRPVHPASPGGDERSDPGAGRSRVEVLEWDRDVRDKLRRGVLVGDPGLGKTWLLKWEAFRRAEEAARRLRQTGDLNGVPIPVYCRLSEVAAALGTPERPHKGGTDPPRSSLANAVIEAATAGTSGGLSDPMREVLREWLGTEHLLLLLDAFDEVPAQRRPALLCALDEWVLTNPQARVLFTSRVVGYQPPWAIAERSETEREMELLPFDDAQMGEFTHAFFAGNPAAASDLRALLQYAPLRGLAQVPLLLGFLCALYHEHHKSRTGRAWKLTRRTDLYEAVLQRLLSGRWKDPPQTPAESKVEAKRELLEPVAFHLFLGGKEQFKLRDVRKAYRVAHAGLYPGQALSEKDVTREVDEWREQDGILVKAGDADDAPYLFLHLTFQEYLSACYLAERINHAGWDRATITVEGREFPAKQFLDRAVWLPAWQEVIILLAGQLNDPVPLLNLLSDGATDDIFRHRLALAALCLPEIKDLLEVPQNEATSGSSTGKSRLLQLRDDVTQDVLDDWQRHLLNNTMAVVLHLDNTFPALVRVKGTVIQGENSPEAKLLDRLGILRVQRSTLLEQMSRWLRSTDWNECISAVFLAKSIGPDAATPDILEPLGWLLFEEDERVVRWIADAIIGIGREAATPTILDTLLHLCESNLPSKELVDLFAPEPILGASRPFRGLAKEVLNSLGTAAAPPWFLQRLLEHMRQEDTAKQEGAFQAALALGAAAGTPDFLEGLTELLHAADKALLVAALNIVASIGRPAATLPIRKRVTELLQSGDGAVQEEALCALCALGGEPVSHDVLVSLVKRINKAGYPNSFSNALEQIADQANNTQFGDYLEDWMHDPEAEKRGAAVLALACVPALVARASLFTRCIELAHDVDEGVRDNVAWAIRALGNRAACPECLEPLLEFIVDDNADLRMTAMNTFERLGEAAGTEPVILRLAQRLKHWSVDVRCMTAQALGSIGPKAATDEVVRGLSELLHSDVEMEAGYAAEGLAGLGERAARPEILLRLLDLLASATTDEVLRGDVVKAIQSMQKIRTSGIVLRRLAELLSAENEDVREAAAAAVAGIGENAGTHDILNRLVELIQGEEEGHVIHLYAARAMSGMMKLGVRILEGPEGEYIVCKVSKLAAL